MQLHPSGLLTANIIDTINTFIAFIIIPTIPCSNKSCVLASNAKNHLLVLSECFIAAKDSIKLLHKVIE